jgi:hypothetical protein|tara:strand:- start:19166 stop:19549 length:384 start_codon:yes stop_codon:yes gene_type:complete
MEKKMKNYLLVLSTLLLLIMGCSKSIDVQLDPELTVFVSAGSDKTIQLTKQDAAYKMLSEWLRENKAGWLPTSGRYAGGIYLTSGSYGIQVIDTKVVLYSSITDNPSAIYAQEIERSDLRALKDLAK